jgi:hypothetical protein
MQVQYFIARLHRSRLQKPGAEWFSNEDGDGLEVKLIDDLNGT